MSAQHDPDGVNRRWRYHEDVERAVVDARRLVDGAMEEDFSISRKLAGVEAAAEVLFDGPGRDPMLIYRAMNVLAKEWRYVELTRSTTPEQRLCMRVRITVLRARALHIAGDSRRAFEQAWAAHTAIEAQAGGRDAMLELLASPEPNILAECMIAILGIFAASLKRDLPPTHPVRAYWLGEIRTIVDSYIPRLEAERAMIYPGTPRVVQVLYFLAEHRDPADADRIRALRRIDDMARPRDARGEATLPLRSIAIANFEGHANVVALDSPRALQALACQDLERHIDVVKTQHYIAS
jgi:hypothetical protein